MREEHKGLSTRWLYWSPGNSPRVNAIVDHLTPGEQRRYRVYSVLVGLVLGLAMAGLSPLLLFLILELRVRMPALIAGVAAYAAVLCLVFYGIQRLSASFLKSTAWSKAQGWDKEPLQLKVWHGRGGGSGDAK